MDILTHLQWPAMVITVVATWLVACEDHARRCAGFWWFLISNVLWTAWGWHTDAYALVALQICLAAMNIKGAIRQTRQTRQGGDRTGRRPL